MVSNLVSNALQYQAAGGDVTLSVAGGDAEVVMKVHNHGPAIPAKVLKKIFEPMDRHTSELVDKNISGLGLGLYISPEIVSAHGGTIAVTSKKKLGTTFTVHLPRRPVVHTTPDEDVAPIVVSKKPRVRRTRR